jgi:hypothetical protein
MFIPGPKLTQVFASRWKALLWAASILATAYFFIPKQGEDNAQQDAQAASIARQILPADTPVPTSTQASPWALPDSSSSAGH